MANLKSIKSKILSYKKTGTVTRAMQSVSAVKMRKAQERALSGRAYAGAALSVLERIASTAEARHHSLVLKPHGIPTVVGFDKTCVIVVTSDKGLAGSLNSSVIRKVEQELAKRGLTTRNVVVIGVGRRGADHFRVRGYDVRARYENVADSVSEADTRSIIDTVLEWQRTGDIQNCLIAYTNFVSTFEQEAVIRQIIPVTPQMVAEVVAGIRPARGKYAGRSELQKHKAPDAYTIEPDISAVLEALLPKLLNIAVFHGLLESKASEHSARMVAMKSATDKAKEMAQLLTRKFNKVRQAVITREVSEITSGIEAMR
jgi:F-type H+-transporting ATPase subunit gamma